MQGLPLVSECVKRGFDQIAGQVKRTEYATLLRNCGRIYMGNCKFAEAHKLLSEKCQVISWDSGDSLSYYEDSVQLLIAKCLGELLLYQEAE